MADCVSEPTILWVLETTMSAPSDSAWRGQVLVEGQVRAPRLVDHERHPVGVGDLGQRRHVGHRAEVGGRDGGGADRVRAPRRARGRAPRGSGSVAMPSSGSTSGATKCGVSPARMQPSTVLEWALRWTTTRVAGVREREQRDVVALRRAVAPGTSVRAAPHASRRQLLGLPANGVGLGRPVSMPQ